MSDLYKEGEMRRSWARLNWDRTYISIEYERRLKDIGEYHREKEKEDE